MSLLLIKPQEIVQLKKLSKIPAKNHKKIKTSIEEAKNIMDESRIVAKITGGSNDGKLLLLSKDINNLLKIEDNNGLFSHVPNLNTRDVLFISGSSGSGKTWYAKNYSEYYRKLINKNIFIFSAQEQDKVEADYPFNFQYIDIRTNEFADSNLNNIRSLAESLVIFDDIDQIDEKINDKIISLIKMVLNNGRKEKIYVIITGHELLGSKKTKMLLSEATSVTFFPRDNGQTAGYYLKNYNGMTPKMINKILNLPSRWITYFKSYPKIILYEHGCYLPTILS